MRNVVVVPADYRRRIYMDVTITAQQMATVDGAWVPRSVVLWTSVQEVNNALILWVWKSASILG